MRYSEIQELAENAVKTAKESARFSAEEVLERMQAIPATITPAHYAFLQLELEYAYDSMRNLAEDYFLRLNAFDLLTEENRKQRLELQYRDRPTVSLHVVADITDCEACAEDKSCDHIDPRTVLPGWDGIFIPCDWKHIDKVVPVKFYELRNGEELMQLYAVRDDYTVLRCYPDLVEADGTEVYRSPGRTKPKEANSPGD